jgi:RNA polymerase-binding protein DksA
VPRADGKIAAAKAAAEKAPAPVSAAKAPSKAGAVKPAAVRPAAVKPAATKPAAVKPAVAKPAVTKAAVTKAAVAKPAVTKAAVSKAVVTKAAATRPIATKPPATKPLATKPPATKPTATKAAAKSAATGDMEAARVALIAELARLTSERESLQAGLDEVIRDSASGSGDDQADSGAKTFGREQEQGLLDRVAEAVDQTERALARVGEGTYGICESCGNQIGSARLEAYPRATLCVACKQREERR